MGGDKTRTRFDKMNACNLRISDKMMMMMHVILTLNIKRYNVCNIKTESLRG
jgi:hypothetical protein